MPTFPTEAIALLGKRPTAVITTLLPDGTPHSVVAGVVLDGEQLVSFTGPTAKRLKNLAANPAITVVAIDPETSMRYLEVRGTATLVEGDGDLLRNRFKEHAAEHAGTENLDQVDKSITVVQIRITPTKVSYHEFDPSQLGPIRQQAVGTGGPTAPRELPEIIADGVVEQRDDGIFIEFQRPVDHTPDETWAALTEPSRLAIWQHPVEFIPELREGATIYAQLNPQVKAVALGKVTTLRSPTEFAFRWTTNNAQLPPEFTIACRFEDGILHVTSGPFGPQHGMLGLATSFHIHLDHLEEAITTAEADLPKPPYPAVSVVTRSGLMGHVAQAYFAKYPQFAPPAGSRTP